MPETVRTHRFHYCKFTYNLIRSISKLAYFRLLLTFAFTYSPTLTPSAKTLNPTLTTSPKYH